MTDAQERAEEALERIARGIDMLIRLTGHWRGCHGSSGGTCHCGYDDYFAAARQRKEQE